VGEERRASGPQSSSAGIGPRSHLQPPVPAREKRLPPLPSEQGVPTLRRARTRPRERKRGKTTDEKEGEGQRSGGTQATCMLCAAKRRHRAGTRRKGYTRNYDHRP